jgi:cytidyltransferase-like protein
MSDSAKQVVVTGSFDDIRSTHIRFLEEASKLGELTVLLWEDESVHKMTGKPPKFPEAERQYILEAIRFVTQVKLVAWNDDLNSLPMVEAVQPQIWVESADKERPAVKRYCEGRGIRHHVMQEKELQGFPATPAMPSPPGRKKIIVTGCYDWLHSGHVRFFEEVSSYGDVYAAVGNDANVKSLKGEHHPMHNQDERRYIVGSIRFVKQALITSGQGWLDAEPEIDRLKPDIYAVNEDGDKGGKREFCEKRGIQYLVLKRTPAPGLTARSSTNLRGF